MTERKGLSKKVRFEIFKRDNFTCQYCGGRPPEVVLEVDHIHPVAEGGTNDEMNLLTSCETCNRGKGARKLDNIPNRPDADLEWLELQQEVAELRRYQMALASKMGLQDQIIKSFQELWHQTLGTGDYIPSKMVFMQWLGFASPEQIEESIRISGGKGFTFRNFDHALSYTAGVLRNITGTRKASHDQ